MSPPTDSTQADTPDMPSPAEPLAIARPAPCAVVGSQRFVKHPAALLGTLPGLGHVNDKISVDKKLRQMERGEVDPDGNDITGHWVVADAGGAMLFDEMANARRWANNKNMVNIELAPSLTYIDSGYPNGGMLAVVNTTDLIALLVAHPKNKGLQRETTTAYVQRETGAVAGIARAVQAATAPTEGQRALQAGFEGAIAEGESRTEESVTTDAEGRQTAQRLVERGVLLPDGQGVHVQQAQSVVQAGKSEFDGLIHNLTHMVNAITTSAEFMGKVHRDVNQLSATTACIEKRVLSLERGQGIAKKARAPKRERVTWNRTDHPELPKNILFRDGYFGWKKTHNKEGFCKYGFATLQGAVQNLAGFEFGRLSHG